MHDYPWPIQKRRISTQNTRKPIAPNKYSTITATPPILNLNIHALTMKHITASAILLLPIILLGCSKSNSSASDAQIAQLKAEVAQLQSAKPPAPIPTGELTRELAAKLLNESLASPHISELGFLPNGVAKAHQDGILTGQYGLHIFTPKGIELFHGLVNETYRLNDFDHPERLAFQLLFPIGERVTQVTGIAQSPMPNIFEATYTTAYLLPTGAEGMLNYVYSGQNTKGYFQKYDDGWRYDPNIHL